MTTLTIDSDSLALSDALGELLAKTGNLEPAFRDIGEYLMSAHRERFAAQQSPDGQAWAALTPKYLKQKRKNKDRILYLDGYLANTLRYQVSADELTFGSNRPYAAIHHFGGVINMPARMRTLHFKLQRDGSVGNKFVKKKRSDFAQDVQGKPYTVNMPARPWLGTSDADNLEILNIILRHLTGDFS